MIKMKIEKMDHTGNGIGYIEGKICFVPKAVVGDFIQVEIVKNSSKFNIGRIKKIDIPSENRIAPVCPFYQICGGCHINNLSYQEQLEFKKSKVKNIFKRYLDMDINPEIVSSNKEYEYRNKITFHSDGKKLGLVSLDGSVIDVSRCLLVSNKVNELYEIIKEEDLSKVKRIKILECDNGLIVSIEGKMKIDKFAEKCLSIYMDDKCVCLKEEGYIMIGDIKYLISNRSFFQINTSNVSKLYDLIVKYGNFLKSDRVIDLYCGVGSISLYIAKYVKEVLGIEIVDAAIKDAKRNARLNNIDNVSFICGDVSKLINNKLQADTVIVDPPRVGLDKHTKEVLNIGNIKKLIYVSCDPMTLARDIKELSNYELKEITLVDMFPQTYHVECCALLCLKENYKLK